MCPARRKRPHRTQGNDTSGPKKLAKREVPKAELGFPAEFSLLFAPRVFPSERQSLKQSKPFQESPPKEYPALFEEKCNECCVLCDFTVPNAETKLKETKSRLLKHLASCFTIPHFVRTVTPQMMELFYKMLAINLFRPFPYIRKEFLLDDASSFQDLSWPHLSLAYDALLSSFSCPLPNSLRPEFIRQLIGNAFALDDRERIAVRDILHSLYTKFMNHRTLVRESIADYFASGYCSPELLQFFSSVVSGFNSPLNPEHVTFYHRSILPLYDLHQMPKFSVALLDLIVNYISKSGMLLEPTIAFLIKHWPRAHRAKQGLFLKAIETLLLQFEINVNSKMATSVFQLLGNSVNNQNCDVAEIAIDIITNPKLSFMLKAHASQVFPLIMKPAYEASQKHWDECTRSNAFVALQSLSELDQSTFMQISDNFNLTQHKQSEDATISADVKSGWRKVFDAVKRVDHDFQLPSLDFLC